MARTKFQRDLKNLLLKYKVNISFRCDDCSDIEGIIDPKIAFVSDDKILFEKEGYRLGEEDIDNE